MSDSGGYSSGTTYENPSTGGYTYYGRSVDYSGNSHYVDSYTDKYGSNYTKVYNYDEHSSTEIYYNSGYNSTQSSYNSYDSGK